MSSTLIRGGRLIDPANDTDGLLNLLIRDGRVVWCGTEEPAADEVIDAAGRVVAPGFIDIHMHEDPIGENGEIKCCIFDRMLRMGVTTAVGGNCGSVACAPADYFAQADNGVPVNVALFAGHSSIRRRAGVTDRYASATE